MATDPPAAFYVDPVNGNDANGGISIQSAFRTIERAKNAVKTICGNMTSDITVHLAGGIHELTNTLTFTPDESGTNGFRIIYRNLNQSKPVISGGATVNATWQPHEGNILKAFIGTGRTFRQLYVNDGKAVRSRTPNTNQYSTLPTVPENKIVQGGTQTGLYITPGWINSAVKPDEIEISVLIEWMNKRFRINRLETDAVGTKAVINGYEWECMLNGPQAKRDYQGYEYFLENAYEFLDSPNEWYYDNATGYLYYYPAPGQDLSTAKIVIPSVEGLIRLDGTLDGNVRNIVFSGIEFRYSAWNYPSQHGLVDVQANTLVPSPAVRAAIDGQYRHKHRKNRVTAAFTANSSSGITIDNCSFLDVGGTGVTLAEGGEDNTIKNCAFSNISGSGIEVGNTAQHPNDPRMLPRRLMIFNNNLTKIGVEYAGAVGIVLFYVDTAVIEHNTIKECSYSGISAGWGWSSDVNTDTKNIVIRYNHIHNANHLLRDGGFIYTLNSQANSLITDNYLKSDSYTDGVGIYTDEASAGWLIKDNVVEGSFRKTYNAWTVSIHDINLIDNFVNDGQVMNTGTHVNIVSIYRDTSPSPVWPERAREIIRKAGFSEQLRSVNPVLPGILTQSILIDYPDSRIQEQVAGSDADATVRGFGNSAVRSVNGWVRYHAKDGAGKPLRGFYRISAYKPDFGQWKTTNVGELDTAFQMKVKINGRLYSSMVFNDNGGDTQHWRRVINNGELFLNGGFVNLGVFYLDGTDNNYVELLKTSATRTYADAVKFEQFTFADPTQYAQQVAMPRGLIPTNSGTDKVLIDNQLPNIPAAGAYLESGTWENGTQGSYHGFTTATSLSNGTFRQGKSSATATFRPTLGDGYYKVYLYVNRVYDDSAFATTRTAFGTENGKVTVQHGDGTDVRTMNFRTGLRGWHLLGAYRFDTGTGGYVELKNDSSDSNSRILSDAVYFEKQTVPLSLSVKTPPAKTAYIEGQAFDPAGLEVEALYADNSTALIEDFTITPAQFSTSDSAVTITYLGKQTSTPVTVVGKTLSSISVSTLPTVFRYKPGQTFGTSGGRLTLLFDNGTSTTIDLTPAMCSGYDLNVLGIQPVTVTYMSGGVTQSTSYPIFVTQKLLTGISISQPPSINSFYRGEPFAVDGRITLTYDDNSTEETDITPGMCSGHDLYTNGRQTVTVTVEEKTATYTIRVDGYGELIDFASAKLVYFNSTVYPAANWIQTGDLIKPANPTAFMTDDTHVVSSFSTSGKTVTSNPLYLLMDLGAVYQLSRIDFKCPINETRGPKSWSAYVSTSQPLFDATRTNGSMTEFVTSGANTWGGAALDGTSTYGDSQYASSKTKRLEFYPNTSGRYVLIKVYESLNTTQIRFSDVQVAGYRYLSTLNVTRPPAKTSYFEGQRFDSAGMLVTATYSGGFTRNVSGFSIPEADLKVGDTEVTITYYGVAATIPVTVQKVIEAVTATPNPVPAGPGVVTVSASIQDVSGVVPGALPRIRWCLSANSDRSWSVWQNMAASGANAWTIEVAHPGAQAANTRLYYEIEAMDFGGNPTTAAGSLEANWGGDAYEAWRLAHFTPEQLANASVSGDNADPDGDGSTNLNEYRAGTDPLDAGSRLVMILPTSSGPVNGEFVVAWQSAPGKIYTLQSSTDLATGFSNLMMHIPATPPLNVHTDTNATSPRKFYRVLVEP